MKFILLILIMLGCTVTYGASCEDSSSNMAEVYYCVQEQSAAPVKRAYNSLLSLLSAKQLIDQLAAAKNAQAAWEKYEEATCEYARFTAKNSLPDAAASNCIVEFNTARVKILKKYIALESIK